VRDRFLAIYTAALADILDARGLRAQTLPPSIQPLEQGARLAGQAYTIKGRPAETEDYDAALRKVLAVLGSIPEEHVAVYACEQEASAHLGELSVTALKVRQVAGCVVDGGCRDVRFIRDEGFPVFCRYVTPEDSTWRWALEETQVPVTIGGVRITPGDWVVGDDDGVVVVPFEIADRVLAEAEQKAATESRVRSAIREGMSPLAAYDEYGAF
jgi:4-hydroxy-4-methyl-2-oxoglutarate aldolase